MTPPAAEELLNVIMLDDFVDRRKALDVWTRRWIATAEIVFDRGATQLEAKTGMLGELMEGLLTDEVRALEFGKVPTGDWCMRLHTVRIVPRES